MNIDPSTYYDEQYWSAKKPYRILVNGEIEERLYAGPAMWWDGFGPLAHALLVALRIVPGTSWFDIGCGAGCFVAYLRRFGIDARGADISRHAIESAKEEVAPFVACDDVLVDHGNGAQYRVVSALDLVEHVYLPDQPRLWDTFARLLAPGGMLVLDIGTAHRPTDIWTANKDIPVPLEREWQAVSGHVCVETAQFWYAWAQERGWTVDFLAMRRFEQWRTSTPSYDQLDAWGPFNLVVARR